MEIHDTVYHIMEQFMAPLRAMYDINTAITWDSLC